MEHHPESFEPPPTAPGETEAHLDSCPACRDFVKRLHDMIALGIAYLPGAVPGPLSHRARVELEIAWQKCLAARAHRPAK